MILHMQDSIFELRSTGMVSNLRSRSSAKGERLEPDPGPGPMSPHGQNVEAWDHGQFTGLRGYARKATGAYQSSATCIPCNTRRSHPNCSQLVG